MVDDQITRLQEASDGARYFYHYRLLFGSRILQNRESEIQNPPGQFRASFEGYVCAASSFARA
jgi:hypothetical protein